MNSELPFEDGGRVKPKSPLSLKRANDLDGKTWLKYSISIWSDIRKSEEEKKLKHPAMFPISLATRLIQCFTTSDDEMILDPFVGIGSTAIAAENMGKVGIGIEISSDYCEVAKMRKGSADFLISSEQRGERRIYCDDARNLFKYVKPESIDLVITSPPYWNILSRRRTADYKPIRDYGDHPSDLGKIQSYEVFLKELKKIFELVFKALKPEKYCCVVVMDLRQNDRFYPFHSDVAQFMTEIGFIWDDIIIWDRRQEYNNIRPLGYPTRFRINKTHEFILLFQKPKVGSQRDL